MDSIKEIFEAMGQRIRSPFWGYVFLSFVLLNWKPLFYLCFAQQPVAVKFRFFELNTGWQSLYILPLILGLVATLASPHISELAARWAEKPINRKRIREVDAAHQVLQAKNRFAAERENERSIYEQSLIDRAIVDEQVEAISDPEKRQAVSTKIEENRDQSISEAGFWPKSKSVVWREDVPSEMQEMIDSLNKREIHVIAAMSRLNKKVRMVDIPIDVFMSELTDVIANLNETRLKVEVEDSFKALSTAGLVRKAAGGYWALTSRGYQIADAIGK